MTDFVGKHQHEFKSTVVYCNADGPAKGTGEDFAREKAVRKVVRAIIESNGGDGKTIKKDIDTDYPRGVVWYQDARVLSGRTAAWYSRGSQNPMRKPSELLISRTF